MGRIGDVIGYRAAPMSTLASPRRDLSFAVKRALVTRLHPLRSFRIGGRRLHYHAAAYNAAWSNERTVEVPIVTEYLRERRGGRILEVGNVLHHYLDVNHDVVDKYEQHPRVRNVDVVEFAPETRYDLIVSISTLEHVGFDEERSQPDKPVRAVAHLAGLLAPGGMLVVTVPLGYNPHLDVALAEGRFAFDEVTYLSRISRDNRWREVSAAEVRRARYGAPYHAANALAVGISNSR